MRKLGNKGAVLAEFVIAIIPLMTVFFYFVQLSKIATARLVVKHGTIIGARAASVISNVHNNVPDAQGDGQAQIEAAVKVGMEPWTGKIIAPAIGNIKVEVDDQSSTDPYGWVTVTVTATYHCEVPMAGLVMCGIGGRKILKETARMPHQGATYKMGMLQVAHPNEVSL